MQFVDYRVDFGNVVPFDEHLTDPSKVKLDVTNNDELARYAVTVYATKTRQCTEWVQHQMDRYKEITIEAIKVDNINGVDTLQTAISYYDYGCVEFDDVLLAAAEFGSLKTFLYALENKRFGSIYYDDPPRLHLPTLVNLAGKNTCTDLLIFLNIVSHTKDPKTSCLPGCTCDNLEGMYESEDVPEDGASRAKEFDRLIKEAIDAI